MSNTAKPAESSPIEPMEALLVDTLPNGPGWSYEPKWDGFRCLTFKEHGTVRLFAKSGKPLHRYFPEVVAALERIKADDFVLDGELTLPLGDFISFDILQQRLHPAASRIRKLSVDTPAVLIIFDLLVAPGGKPIGDQILENRRVALERFFAAQTSPSLRLSPTTNDVKTAKGWLGVVSK